MADTVDFELVSPARLVASESVEMVVVPGGEGDFGVLPGHTPMLSTVRPGLIDIYENDLTGNGNVGIADFNLFLPGFIRGEPGPSAPGHVQPD